METPYIIATLIGLVLCTIFVLIAKPELRKIEKRKKEFEEEEKNKKEEANKKPSPFDLE